MKRISIIFSAHEIFGVCRYAQLISVLISCPLLLLLLLLLMLHTN